MKTNSIDIAELISEHSEQEYFTDMEKYNKMMAPLYLSIIYFCITGNLDFLHET